MAKGTINDDGMIIITFDPLKEHLYAPNVPEGLKYLPCEHCGEVDAVELSVYIFVCFFCRA